MLSRICKVLLFTLCFHPVVVLADIYRCNQDPGVITLSNVEKGKNCEKMKLPPPEPRQINQKLGSDALSNSAQAEKNKPSIKNKTTYEEARAERKRIIEEEIELEKNRLNEVNAKLKPLNGVAKKTPEQVSEIAALQKKQNLHQGNLKLLNKELAKP